VAAGVNPTDAVNVAQLNSVVSGLNYQPQIDNLQSQINDTNKRVDNANAGVAMAMAMGGGGLPETKKYAVGVNYGTFAGQNAFALSSALRLSDNLVASGAIGVTSICRSRRRTHPRRLPAMCNTAPIRSAR
jgi:autotransporter adhesin